MAHTEVQVLMRLFTYVVARDYGFAPNPFYGYCTLATCKPKIRATALTGDWIVGTGAKTKYDRKGYLIYAMKVDEVMDYESYWNDSRFLCKKPVMNGSLKQLYGDNIYYRINGHWVQVNSHHSLDTGKPNLKNIEHDTSVNRILIARKFVYYGSAAPLIPKRFRRYRPTNEDICCPGRGYAIKSPELTVSFESWLENRGEWGVRGMPLEFNSHKHVLGQNGNQ
jgi:hypothetical protein